jgi:putative membrane protein
MGASGDSFRHFWWEAFARKGDISWRILPSVVIFAVIGTIVDVVYHFYPQIAIEVGPHEVAGAFLGVLLVMRTNAGHDRWWEARKLWGGIVTRCRNLALATLAYGPAERAWREQVVRWTAAFAHAARGHLREQKDLPELTPLLGEEEAARVRRAEHMPAYVALRIGQLLRQGCEKGMDHFGFLQADRERAPLIEHLGGCERILRTPPAAVLTIATHRFILVYLTTLPFALLHKFDEEWLVPVVTVVAAWALLALDQVGIELQQPFRPTSLSSLPLDDLCRTIENNLLALLDEAG